MASCKRVSSSHDIPLRYAFTYGGYLFAFSSPKERADPTMAESKHARSSPVVIGRLSLFVSGLGIGTRDMTCEGSGCMRVDRESWMISDSVLNHIFDRRLNMLREKYLCLHLDGIALMFFCRFCMYSGLGAFLGV